MWLLWRKDCIKPHILSSIWLRLAILTPHFGVDVGSVNGSRFK